MPIPLQFSRVENVSAPSQQFVKRLAAFIGSRNTTVSVIESGQNNRVLDFGDRIVRVPRHVDAIAELRREATLLTELRPLLPVAVPDVAMHESEIGPIAVHDRLPGEPLLSLTGASDQYQDVIATGLAGILRCLHGLPRSIIRDGRREDEWRTLLERLPVDLLPHLSAGARRAANRAFDDFLVRAHERPLAIVHGDFGTGNILADERGVTGVIDFAGCGLGDPAYDLASLAAGLGDDFMERLKAFYPAISAMARRISFYRNTFPLSDMAFGIDHADRATLAAGIAGAEQVFG